MSNAYLSLQELATPTTLENANRILVLFDADGADPGTSQKLGDVDFDAFKTWALSEVNQQITELQARPGNGAFATPVTMSILGPVTGSVTFDGSQDFSFTSKIADGAIEISKIFGLSSQLSGLSSDIANNATAIQTLQSSTHNAVLTFGNGLVGGSYDGSTAITASLGTPGTLGNGSSNKATVNSHTHALNLTAADIPSLSANKITGLSAVATSNAYGDLDGLPTLGTAASKSVSYFATPSSNITGTSAGWTTARILTLTGDVTGSVSINGKNNVSLATTLNDSNLALAGQGLGKSSFYTNMNANSQSTVLGHWNASTSNITGMDSYGTALTIGDNGTTVVSSTNYVNQLCLGTGGKFTWRQNVNNGGWTTRTIWTSKDFNPSNFLVKNTAASMSSASISGSLTAGSTTLSSLTVGGETISAASFYNTVLTELGGSVDLNTVTSSGNYSQSQNADASSGTNYPGTTAGLLEVFVGATMIWQRYTEYQSGGKSYQRCRYRDSWGAWQETLAPDSNGGLTMSGSISSGGSITASNTDAFYATNTEGQAHLGNNTYYYFGNANNGGYYSMADGYAYQWNFASRVFTVYGAINRQSDARCKKDFVKMAPRPLWRDLDFLSFKWKASNLDGYGPKAQDVLKVAPEYVNEDKTVSIQTSLGGSKKKVENSLKRIAEGKEQGMLSVDKTNLALETAMAAGRLVDTLEATLRKKIKSIEALEKKVSRLEKRLKKAA